MRRIPVATLAAGLAAAPTFAVAQTLNVASVASDSALPIKALMLLLVAAGVAAVVITVRKSLAEPTLTGGSAFLAALRLGGPLVGLLGASLNALWSFIAIASVGATPPLAVLAPGLAEATLLLTLGLAVGIVAVICNWIVDARIDRAVLRA